MYVKFAKYAWTDLQNTHSIQCTRLNKLLHKNMTVCDVTKKLIETSGGIFWPIFANKCSIYETYINNFPVASYWTSAWSHIYESQPPPRQAEWLNAACSSSLFARGMRGQKHCKHRHLIQKKKRKKRRTAKQFSPSFYPSDLFFHGLELGCMQSSLNNYMFFFLRLGAQQN